MRYCLLMIMTCYKSVRKKLSVYMLLHLFFVANDKEISYFYSRNVKSVALEIIYYIDLLGTMVFAISGAMAAVRNNIDLFGAAFTGFVTAIGGGSLRDIFLNLRPVWVDDGNYLLAILAGVLIAIWLRSILGKFARTLF